MKNLIRKILKENVDDSDFSWVDDVISNHDYSNLEPGQFWYLANYGPIKSLKKMVPFEVASSFGDIEVSGDKILLIAEDGFCNFKNFFTDRDSVQYGRVNSYLVEKIFCDEDGDYWEPYDDTYSKWYDDIWEDMVIPNKKLYEYISKYFKEEYVIPNEYNPKQLDIFGELPKSRKIYSIEDLMLDEGKRILDEEYFIWLKEHPEKLGRLIANERVFIDLKRDLGWSYDDAYNTAARDNIYKAIKNEITDNFGEGQWSNFVMRGGEHQVLKFDITNVFTETVNNYFNNCFEWCLRDSSNVENPEEYCDHCHDFEQYKFRDLYSDMLENESEKWSPRFSEYPDGSDIEMYFEESLYNRF
jgi:hypothetical protein